MNVSVSPQHKAFVKAQVTAGRFRNDSEVVRAGIRLLEEHERQRRLEELLLEGLESGEPIDMDDAYWSSLRHRVSRRIGSERDNT